MPRTLESSIPSQGSSARSKKALRYRCPDSDSHYVAKHHLKLSDPPAFCFLSAEITGRTTVVGIGPMTSRVLGGHSTNWATAAAQLPLSWSPPLARISAV